MEALKRLFRPRSIAVIGGGVWCEAVLRECRKIGFDGDIWPVHPKKDTVGGLPAFASLDTLPGTPDAAFIGVNRALTVEITAQLARLGCGGAVCFANGFREALAELPDGPELQDRLAKAAGDMAILGPNCYGFVNALDGVALWPDMHGMTPVERGVAIVGQSSNVLINMTMQTRGLPLAVAVAAGNQAKCTMTEIGMALLDDPRITALGLHIEGITDVAGFERLSERARALAKPIVALKVGSSEQAQVATISHTASLAGSAAGARALLARLGIAQVESPTQLIETLKILHVTGHLPSAQIVSASCSGGEASLMADLGERAGVRFPPLVSAQTEPLRTVLGPHIALANPLDYNTYIWGDEDALADCFTALMRGPADLGCVVIDFPRTDRFASPDWNKLIDAAKRASVATGKPVALLSLLSEGMPERVAQVAIAQGLIPLCGMQDSLAAIAAAAHAPTALAQQLLPVPVTGLGETHVLGEAEAKAILSDAGMRVPASLRAATPEDAVRQAQRIGFPVVLKGEGIAHKTEAGAVKLGLGSAGEVLNAAREMPTTSFLVEEMIVGTVAELLIGVVRDPAHGFVLTIGLGGILTELVADTVSVLVPSPETEIRPAIRKLQTYPLLEGYRGRPAADLDAVVGAIMALQDFVCAKAARLHEIEINPLMCLPTGVVVADALIRMEEEHD